ncbi:TonB-dependent receptor [Parafilimonas sp.]|uniref:TonB-dependent receptor n=1 Tax=Parafilimonas sp. TaxID=1969739 RepID=UPI0039E2A150
MKFTFILILLATMQVAAKTQNINVNFNNTKLVDALKQIEQKSDYRFVFSNKILNDQPAVTLSANNVSIDALLKQLLASTGLKDSLLDNKLIVIKQVSGFANLVKITGTVTDSAGNPLEGVTVQVAGTKTGTTTDAKGYFSLNADENAVLEFSSIGYTDQTIELNGRLLLSVILQKNDTGLDDVVILGYGKQARQKVTSAVTQLKTDNFKDAPYTDIQSAMAGRAAGVVVNFSGGEPGSVPSLTIRGGEPLISQTTALYVIDDIIRDQTAFVNLNTNDIESISFLKDAAATAVYGSKAAAGVVLITTKNGASGKPAITYSNNFALNTPNLFPKLINSYDKALVANAISESEGNGKYAVYSEAQLDTIKNGWNTDKYPNTDWYGLSFRKYSLQQTHNLSVSGGNNQTKYYVGLGYFDQGSNYVNNSFKVKRFSYNSKIISNFDNIGLSVTFALNGYYDYTTQPPAGSTSIFSHIVAKSPLEKAFNDDGTLSALVDHPLAEIYSPGYARGEVFFNDANLTFSWSVPKVQGLHLKLIGDYSMKSNPTKTFNVLATQYNSDGTLYETSDPTLTQESNDTKAYNLQFQADYSRGFGRHNLVATFVSVARGGGNKWFSAYRGEYPSTAIDQLFAGDASTQINDGSESKWGEIGYVGRLKYDYAGKYLLELNGRYDGSDYFPPGNRFGFFPSISAGWAVSSEKFYHDLNLSNIFSYLKFKGSYGRVGSVGGTKYAYVSQYNVTTSAYVIGGTLRNGYYEGALTSQDQDITWYSTTSRDFGLEFEALNRKLSGDIDYFFTRTKNILGSPAYSYSEPLGLDLPEVLTDAATRKEGIDFSINFNWSVGKELKGYIGVNGTYFNYLWERTNEDSASLTNPYTRSWGVDQNYYSTLYQDNGLYQNYEDILNNPSRLTSTALTLGDLWLEDTNGDGKIDAQDYRRLGKSQSPRFTYGMPLGIEYKGFRLDALIQGSGSRNVYLGTYLQGSEGVNRVNFEFQKDYWLSDNTNSSFPRAGTSSLNNGNNYVSSTFWLKNARFVRLKSLTLTYDFKRLIKTNKISDLSLHVSGTNLLTFSPVKKYFDPELANNNNFFYPVNSTYSIGIRATF